jgi:hypothetical protein
MSQPTLVTDNHPANPHAYTRTHVLHVHTFTRSHVHTHTCTHVHTYICTHVHTGTRAHVFALSLSLDHHHHRCTSSFPSFLLLTRSTERAATLCTQQKQHMCTRTTSGNPTCANLLTLADIHHTTSHVPHKFVSSTCILSWRCKW